MFEHRIQNRISWIVVVGWFLMSFNGGFINSVGFMAAGRFVSHVTGLFTMVGVGLGEQHDLEAFSVLLIPIFFMMGAMIAGLLIDRPIYQKKKAHYDRVMAICGITLCIAALTGNSSRFQPGVLSSLSFLILTCFACGLQNGALTSSSGASVRTTHLSGLTTDLGLGLARLMTYAKSDPNYSAEVRANSLRLGTVVSFILGAASGTFSFLHWTYSCLFIAAAIAFYASIMGRKAKYQLTRANPPKPF